LSANDLQYNRPVGTVTAVAATLAAPVLLYLAVRSAIVGLSPAAAAALPPQDFSPLLPALVKLSAVPNQKVAPQTLNVSRLAAQTAPLAFEPFFIAARAEEQAGRLPRAMVLMEEARRRHPSFALSRVQLIAYYQSTSRFQEMLKELDFVLVRSPEARVVIIPELLKLIGEPRGRAALVDVLAKDPDWSDDFFVAAEQQPSRPSDILDLMNRLQDEGRANVERARSLYLRSLLADGQFRHARETFIRYLPEDERSRHAFIFDPSLRGVEGIEPFGWKFSDTSAGRAEVADGEGGRRYLEVAYFGGSNLVLAEQTLALAPGRYAFGFLARSEEGLRAGEISWRVSCLPSGAELTTLRLTGLRSSFGRLRDTFSVPATQCRGQKLELIARPGEISAAVSLQIADLALTRAN
jgi:hypothetical protein